MPENTCQRIMLSNRNFTKTVEHRTKKDEKHQIMLNQKSNLTEKNSRQEKN